MKISKKVFALLLAVVLMLSVLAVGVSAAGTPQGDEWMTVTIETDKGINECATGETVTVTVSIACNYNVPTFRFPIMFDKSVLKTKTLLGQEALNTCATAGTLSFNKSADNCIPEEYNPDEWSCVLFQWVANTTGGQVGCINNPEGEVAFSFELEVLSSAAGKTGTIFIPSESDKLYYMGIEDPEVATTFYYLNPETCAMTFVPANVMVEAPDVNLVPNDLYDSNAVVDEDNLLVYGLATGLASTADVKEYVKATGGATLRVVPTDLGYGTGSQINLLIDGVVVKSYTMVIFGDINGDGDVTGDDVLDIVAFFGLTKTPANDAVFKAADIGVPQDEDINGADVLREVGVFGLTVSIDQADPYAE